MVSLLSKGLVQAQSQVKQAGKADVDALYERYHRGRAISGKGPCFCCDDAQAVYERYGGKA